ncbi:hypothetical protein [Photobacterium kishitanii]|uniref:hypothetical protein n=1 Tax=Photobacterium kishitanii TaxID=318456 RepID=UPI0011B26386|nr:hypothetical protein [Photobacterium kishitanii]
MILVNNTSHYEFVMVYGYSDAIISIKLTYSGFYKRLKYEAGVMVENKALRVALVLAKEN